MKIFKKVMNVIGIIMASLLSILLVIGLMAVPVVSAVSSFFKTENIQKILADIDYTQLIAEEINLDSEDFPELGADVINQLMETEMVEEIIATCVDNIFAILEGEEAKDGLTAEDIQAIAEKHLDELVVILKGYIGDSLPLSDETFTEMARLLVKDFSGIIAEQIPTPEDLGLNAEVISLITNLRNGTYTIMILAVAAVFTVAVLLCQVMRFKGFMWLGVDYCVAAVGSLVLSFVVKTMDLSSLLGDVAFADAILPPIVEIISKELLKGAGILAIIGIVFIIVFVVGRVILKKKAISVQVEPMGV